MNYKIGKFYTKKKTSFNTLLLYIQINTKFVFFYYIQSKLNETFPQAQRFCSSTKNRWVTKKLNDFPSFSLNTKIYDKLFFGLLYKFM